MGVKRRSLTRLVFWQGALLVFLLAFALSFRSPTWQPVFGGETGEQIFEIRTPSIYDFLWSHKTLAKTVLRMGFPMVQYLERYRIDANIPGIVAQVAGWFLGFTPKGAPDMALAQFPGGLTLGMTDAQATSAQELEKDWGVMPVLYSLPPGEGMQAAITLSDQPLVAIYHTHATESFLPVLNKRGAENAFTSDMSKSVVKVGEMLLTELEERYRIPCVHSKTVHDQDSRTGAYYRSESTVKAIKQKYPSCDILLDLHRDSQPKNVTAVTIKGKAYARLMIVIGTNNPNWVANYNFAQQITSRLEDNYPGISRGILYASANYNQNFSSRAILLEVGGIDNTFVECQNSMQAFAWALAATVLPSPPARP